MDYGAERAERAGVPAERIVTTWPLERLREWTGRATLSAQRAGRGRYGRIVTSTRAVLLERDDAEFAALLALIESLPPVA